MTGAFGVALAIAFGVFALDQASKWWVLDGLGLREQLVLTVAPFLNLVLTWNTGVNFGVLASGSETQQIVLATLAIAVSIALLIWARRTGDRRVAAGCGFVVGGALGNAADRLREGAVVDFLNFDCCGIGNPYAFNFADAAIFLGAALLIWAAWREPGGAPESGAG